MRFYEGVAFVMLSVPGFAFAGAKAGFDATPPKPPARSPATVPASAPVSAPSAAAAPDVPPGQMLGSVVMSFTLALGRGEYARAYALTDRAYRQRVTPERFAQEQGRALSAARPMPRQIFHAESVIEADFPAGWRFVSKPSYPAGVAEEARAGRAMVLTDANPFLLHLVTEDGKPRVAAITHGGRELSNVVKGRENR